MPRPVMIGIVGDSGSGKTTITRGIVRALGEEQVTAICTDDYHRFDRKQRTELGITPLHPECNYIDILAQHLRLLRDNQPVLAPTYRHQDGTFGPPVYTHPARFVDQRGPARVLDAGAVRDVRRPRLPRSAGGATPPLEGAARLLAPRLHHRPGADRARPPRAGLGGVHPAATPPRRPRHLVPPRRHRATRSISTRASSCATRCRSRTSPSSSRHAEDDGLILIEREGEHELFVPGPDPPGARAGDRGGDLGTDALRPPPPPAAARRVHDRNATAPLRLAGADQLLILYHVVTARAVVALGGGSARPFEDDSATVLAEP